MPTKHTIAQAKYDKVNRRVYSFRFHNQLDSDIIAKLAEQDSMQGYLKDLIRSDIARTRSDLVHVQFTKAMLDILKEESIRTGLSVPDIVKLIVSEQLFRKIKNSKPVPEND